MQQLHELNEKKLEELKTEKYSVDDLFKKKKKEETQITEKVEEKSLIECKEENIFTKVINKIKNFFKKFKMNE